jgi:hypothetical protein
MRTMIDARPHLRRRGACLAGVLFAAAILSSCGGGSTPTTTTTPGVVPTPAEQAATLEATNTYRTQIVTAATTFNDAVRSLNADLGAGNTAAATAAWKRAQVAFDVFRPELSGGPGAWSAIAGPVDAHGVGGGLHAVEFGLFHGPQSTAAAATPALVLAGATYAIGFFRTIVQPSSIAAHQVENLGYLVTTCLGGDPEPWSHDQVLDVRGVGQGAVAASTTLLPLARLVEPETATLLDRSIGALRQALASLPVDHGRLPQRARRDLAAKAVVLEGVLGQLAGAFDGYTNGRYFA